MSKKYAVTLMIVVVLMSLFVSGIAYAGEEDETPDPVFVIDEDMGAIAIFGDGRLNAFDMCESAAVYYDYVNEQFYNKKGELEGRRVVAGIEIWVVDQTTNVGQLALYVTSAEINEALASAVDVQIAAANGVALYYSPSADSFWFTGPRGYQFTWKR